MVIVNLETDPIKLGGIITMVRSPSDHIKGPRFYVYVRKDPVFVEVSH